MSEVQPKGQEALACKRRATLPTLPRKSRRALPRKLRLRPDRASESARSPRRQAAGDARRRPDALETCAAKLGQPTPRQAQPPYRSVAASPYRHPPRANSVPAAAKRRAAWAIAAPARLQTTHSRNPDNRRPKIALAGQINRGPRTSPPQGSSNDPEALECDDLRTQLRAASLMLRSRQARERGWS